MRPQIFFWAFEQVPRSDDNQIIIDIMNCDDDARDKQDMLADRDELAPFSAGDVQALPPSVTKHLKSHNRFEDWVAFLHLLAAGQIDHDNIAIKLFIDVILFHINPSIHAMRFSKDV